jgi:hypothetical protein
MLLILNFIYFMLFLFLPEIIMGNYVYNRRRVPITFSSRQQNNIVRTLISMSIFYYNFILFWIYDVSIGTFFQYWFPFRLPNIPVGNTSYLKINLNPFCNIAILTCKTILADCNKQKLYLELQWIINEIKFVSMECFCGYIFQKIYL